MEWFAYVEEDLNGNACVFMKDDAEDDDPEYYEMVEEDVKHSPEMVLQLKAYLDEATAMCLERNESASMEKDGKIRMWLERDENGDTAIFHAVMQGDLDEIKRIAELVSVDQCNSHGFHPLHYAINTAGAGIKNNEEMHGEPLVNPLDNEIIDFIIDNCDPRIPWGQGRNLFGSIGESEYLYLDEIMFKLRDRVDKLTLRELQIAAHRDDWAKFADQLIALKDKSILNRRNKDGHVFLEQLIWMGRVEYVVAVMVGTNLVVEDGGLDALALMPEWVPYRCRFDDMHKWRKLDKNGSNAAIHARLVHMLKSETERQTKLFNED